jgi:tetratricopeptide (TPR) repeat protein
MIFTGRASLFVLTFLTLAANAYAQTPREELKQMVEQLQKSAGDNALREKIIKLAASIKPAPAIPEEARRFFVRAVTLQKDAKSPGDYAAAIAEYRQALAIAPWWPDAYFNMSIAQEAGGRFDEARNALSLYLASSPNEADARGARDRVYAMEARQEREDKTKKEQAQAATLRAQRDGLLEKLRGTWQAKFCGPIERFQGCNEAERGGASWYGIQGERAPSTFSFEFKTDGSVLLDAENFAGCPSARVVHGVPVGGTYRDMRWELRPIGGQAREVFSEIGTDGSWIRISCDRPLSGAVTDSRYHYIQFYRP